MRKTPHEHDIEHAEVERRVRFLRNKRDPARDVAPRPVGKPPALECHHAGSRLQRTAQHFQERRLARAVGSENPDEVAAIDDERHVVERELGVTGCFAPSPGRRTPVRERHVGCPQHAESSECRAQTNADGTPERRIPQRLHVFPVGQVVDRSGDGQLPRDSIGPPARPRRVSGVFDDRR